MKASLTRLLIGRRPRVTLVRASILAVLSFLVFRYAFPPVRAQGRSMEPTFHNRSLHFANLLRFLWRDPQPGDLVVIAMTGRNASYLKRVLATPGDRLAFDNGTLLRNGVSVTEPYVVLTGNWTLAEVRLATNEFFVAGDNRSMPMQWHTMGTVDRTKILGGILR